MVCSFRRSTGRLRDWIPLRGCQHCDTGEREVWFILLPVCKSVKGGDDGNVLAATAKQVSKSTIQLVLACQVLF